MVIVSILQQGSLACMQFMAYGIKIELENGMEVHCEMKCTCKCFCLLLYWKEYIVERQQRIVEVHSSVVLRLKD